MTLPVLGECLYKAANHSLPSPQFLKKLIADLGQHGVLILMFTILLSRRGKMFVSWG